MECRKQWIKWMKEKNYHLHIYYVKNIPIPVSESFGCFPYFEVQNIIFRIKSLAKLAAHDCYNVKWNGFLSQISQTNKLFA